MPSHPQPQHPSPTIFFQILLLFFLCLPQTSSTPPRYNQINFKQLNNDLQTLDIKKYLSKFQQIFTHGRIQKLDHGDLGNFLFLVGKMYIYDILPSYIKIDKINQIYNSNYTDGQLIYQSQSNYLLGYSYIKSSAELYENQDAYYYLAILQFMKLTPTLLIQTNINKMITLINDTQLSNPINPNIQNLLKQWQSFHPNKQQLIDILETVSNDMKYHHLHNIQHNLYLSSLYGHNSAKLAMAYMLKHGIGLQKNCSSSASYYLSALKSTKIQKYSFHLEYSDHTNFQKQLYAHKKIDLKSYGQHDPTIWIETTMFDQQTLHLYQNIALNYLTGSQGFIINQTKAAQMFLKMIDISIISRIHLGFLYLNGRGVPKNYTKARILFQRQSKNNKIAKQVLLVMKFYSMGFINQTNNALKTMNSTFSKYTIEQKQFNEKRDQINRKKINNKQPKQKQQQKTRQESQTQPPFKFKSDLFRTSLMKYIVGSLVLSQHINGTKQHAILLIEQAAQQGNPLAIIQMGLILLDGSDSFFDCRKAIQYFEKQALSHRDFLKLIQLAKLAIKKQKYMFAFIKYIQLIMVGYKNAFINAFYLMEMYSKEMFNFGGNSWSITQAKKNPIVTMLINQGKIQKLEHILKTTLPTNEPMFLLKDFDELTRTTSIQETSNTTKIPTLPPDDLQQYQDYIRLKIMQLGIKHQISIIRFFKYKKDKSISSLQRLANTGQNSPHILQSRYLFGSYYHHLKDKNISEKQKNRRAMQQYLRATRSKFLASIIYFIQGGQSFGIDRIISHLLWYILCIMIVSIYFIWQKNKKIDQVLHFQSKNYQEEQPTFSNNHDQNQQLNGNDNGQEYGFKQEKQQQFFKYQTENKQQEYKQPKFSQEQQQNLKCQRNLTGISVMMDQQLKNQQNKQKPQQHIQQQQQYIEQEYQTKQVQNQQKNKQHHQ